MNPFFPPFMTVFLSIFHVLGGAALGHGVRAARQGSDQANFFIFWGGGMGGLPILFDWFFLVMQGHLIYGLIGPTLFLIAAFVAAFIDMEFDTSSVVIAGIGSAAFLLGIFSIPLMLDRLSTFDPGLSDYLFACLFVFLFAGVGATFAWSGYSALIHGIIKNRKDLQQEQKQQRSGGRKESARQGP